MSFERSLLPPGYPRYGQAVDEAAARLDDVPIPIRELWNPWTAPAAMLPFLAWALSVDVWDSAWAEEKQRAVIAASFDLHRHKGTLGGIKDHVALTGSEVVKAVTPPAASFLSPRITAEERKAYLDDLPQLRLYDAWDGEQSAATFWNDWSGEFFDGLFVLENTAAHRSGEFAVYWERGEATPLERAAVVVLDGGLYRVYLYGDGGDGVFDGYLGDPLRFLTPSTARDRYFTFTLAEATGAKRILHSFAIYANADPVNTEPDFVAETGVDLGGVYCGLPVGDYFMPSRAGTRLYRVIYFYRAGRQSFDTRALSFLGDARFGIDDYTAELSTIIPGRRPLWMADEFIGDFFMPADPSLLWRTCDAIVAAKSARDRVLVNTAIFKRMQVGQKLLVGTPLIIGRFSSSWR